MIERIINEIHRLKNTLDGYSAKDVLDYIEYYINIIQRKQHLELIDKAAIIAEIEKLKGQLLRGACASQISMETNCKEEAYNEVLSCINNLEVKEVEDYVE